MKRSDRVFLFLLLLTCFFTQMTFAGNRKDSSLTNSKVHFPPWFYKVEGLVKSAEKGDPKAQCALGFAYEKGRELPENRRKAIKWYKKSADQGFAKAQYRLAYLCRFGKGRPQDYDEAIRLYELAAEQGFAKAQYSLGSMYHFGEGVAQDYSKALNWYKKSADRGNIYAQRCLGMLYESGKEEEISQDYEESFRWYKRAAEQGDYLSQFYLGRMYEEGKGVPQDLEQAYIWCFLSGDEKYCSLLAKQIPSYRAFKLRGIAKNMKKNIFKDEEKL